MQHFFGSRPLSSTSSSDNVTRIYSNEGQGGNIMTALIQEERQERGGKRKGKP
jgi:hypothetical protein